MVKAFLNLWIISLIVKDKDKDQLDFNELFLFSIFKLLINKISIYFSILNKESKYKCFIIKQVPRCILWRSDNITHSIFKLYLFITTEYFF